MKRKTAQGPVFIIWILWLGWLAAEWALFILFWVQTRCHMVPDSDHLLSVSGDRQVDHQALPDSVPGSWVPVPRPLLLRSGLGGSVQDHRRGPPTAGQQHGGEVLQVSGHFHSSAHTHALNSSSFKTLYVRGRADTSVPLCGMIFLTTVYAIDWDIT